MSDDTQWIEAIRAEERARIVAALRKHAISGETSAQEEETCMEIAGWIEWGLL